LKILLCFLYVRRLGLLLLGLLALLLLARPARAQQVFLRQFGPTEGLRAPFIYALAQDRQGYLWLGTGDGLVRYDGSRFVRFGQKDGLAEDFVVSLREDPATGALWVGHYQGGISVKKTASGSFQRATRDWPLPAPLPPAPARCHRNKLPARRPGGQRLAGHRRPGPVAAFGPAFAAGTLVFKSN
jgi:hypothetical protein